MMNYEIFKEVVAENYYRICHSSILGNGGCSPFC